MRRWRHSTSATDITIKNATVWNNKGVALMALGKPTDALQCFNKALGIDPNYAEAKANKADAMGKQQSFNISGTITPTVTISRIGTLFTIVTPTNQATEVVTQAPEIGDTMTVATTKPVREKDYLFAGLAADGSGRTGRCRGYCCGDDEESNFFD